MENKKERPEMRLIDLELEEELDRIAKDYAQRGLYHSGDRLRGQGLAKIRAKLKKEKREGDRKESGIYHKGKLVFNYNGELKYITPTGKIYTAKFLKRNNSYKLLVYLTSNPAEEHASTELVKVLNKVRADGDFPDKDRRVRDTIQNIRKQLGIIKANKQDDFFIVNKKNYGLGCAIEIIH